MQNGPARRVVPRKAGQARQPNPRLLRQAIHNATPPNAVKSFTRAGLSKKQRTLSTKAASAKQLGFRATEAMLAEAIAKRARVRLAAKVSSVPLN